MDIFSYESARRIGDQNVLRKVDALLNWSLVLPHLKSGLNRSGLVLQGYDEIVLLKCLLISQWHGLSYPKLEESLRVRFDFMPLQHIVDFPMRWLRQVLTMGYLPRSVTR